MTTTQIYRHLKNNTLSKTDSELWHGLIVAPIVETFVFCYLPYLLYLQVGRFWEIGVASSLLFALMHLRFGKNFVLVTFVLGLIFWIVMVSAGAVYVALLHFFIVLLDLTFGVRKFLASD